MPAHQSSHRRAGNWPGSLSIEAHDNESPDDIDLQPPTPVFTLAELTGDSILWPAGGLVSKPSSTGITASVLGAHAMKNRSMRLTQRHPSVELFLRRLCMDADHLAVDQRFISSNLTPLYAE